MNLGLNGLLGICKFYMTRMSNYFSVLMGLQIMYLFVIRNPMGIDRYFWLLFFAIAGLLVFFLDYFVVSENDIDYFLMRSKSFREMCDKVDYLYKEMCLNDKKS